MQLVHGYCFDIYACKSLKSGQNKTRIKQTEITWKLQC